MLLQDKMLKILAGIVTAIVIIFFASRVYDLVGKTYATQTAIEETIYESIASDMYVIRDETMLITPTFGVSVPLAANGERVSKDSAIVAMFSSESAAENYVEKQTLKKRLDSYVKIDSQLRLANIDIKKLNEEINSEFYSLIDGAYDNDYSGLGAHKLLFGEKLSRKQISLDVDVDCKDKISALQNQISTLESTCVPREIITADASGYYVSNADGYENILTTEDISSLTVERINNAVENRTTEQPEGFIGKVISGYNWYIAAVVDSGDAVKIAEKKSYKLILDDIKEPLKVQFYKVISDKDQKSIVIFKCNLMNEELTSLRVLKGKIVLNEVTGLKVPRDAVRVENDGSQAVYIRRGNVVKIKSIYPVYSEETFVIAKQPSNQGSDNENNEEASKKIILPHSHLSLYDEIIISGKELRDGMVIG